MQTGLQEPSRTSCFMHPGVPPLEDHRAGDLICPICGVVIMERAIDVRAEWRVMEAVGADPVRVGSVENPLFEGADITTFVGPTPLDSAFKVPQHLKNKQSQLLSALKNAIQFIGSMATRLNVPKNVSDRAEVIYKRVYEANILRSRSCEAKCAACFYIACRQDGTPRSFQEIVAVSSSSKKEIGRIYKQMIEALKIDLDVVNSYDFMTRFCASLGLPMRVENTATRIAENAVKIKILVSRSPISVASAAIYAASYTSEKIYERSAEDIAMVAGVVPRTVQTVYEIIFRHAKCIIPEGVDKKRLPIPRI